MKGANAQEMWFIFKPFATRQMAKTIQIRRTARWL